VIEINSI